MAVGKGTEGMCVCVFLCMYVCMYVCMTNRYMLFSLNTDDINYTNKTLSLCMYVCIPTILMNSI